MLKTTHTSKINIVCFFSAYLNLIQKLDQTVIARPPVALSLAYMLFQHILNSKINMNN